MRTLTNWLLAGALAASLTWNWTLARAASPAPEGAGDPSCSAGTCPGVDAVELGLDAEQRAAMRALCQRSCAEGDRLERRADELQQELLRHLSASEVDGPAAHELVRQVAELRRESLESCVAGILEVREVLTPAQLEALLGRCVPGSTECAPGSCKR